VLFRGSVGLVLAQAFGAFCFGVGYAALRWRTNAIWPLMAMHLATDLFAAIGGMPKIPVLVAQDVVLLVLGAYLIRRDRTSREARGHAPWPPQAVTDRSAPERTQRVVSRLFPA
jgi:hypothetical protein